MNANGTEHWIVVRSTAKVTCGGCPACLARTNRSFLPLGAKHLLENPGKVLLRIIEVQSGSFLGEVDIVRFDNNLSWHG